MALRSPDFFYFNKLDTLKCNELIECRSSINHIYSTIVKYPSFFLDKLFTWTSEWPIFLSKGLKHMTMLNVKPCVGAQKQ